MDSREVVARPIIRPSCWQVAHLATPVTVRAVGGVNSGGPSAYLPPPQQVEGPLPAPLLSVDRVPVSTLSLQSELVSGHLPHSAALGL